MLERGGVCPSGAAERARAERRGVTRCPASVPSSVSSRAEIRDADGVLTHVVVAHATPGVTHLRGHTHARGPSGAQTRAWMPSHGPSAAAPRSVDHARDGWYFRNFPQDAPRGRASRRMQTIAASRRHVDLRHILHEFGTIYEGLGLGFGFSVAPRRRHRDLGGRRAERPTTLASSAPVARQKFRTPDLDRQRGELSRVAYNRRLGCALDVERAASPAS